MQMQPQQESNWCWSAVAVSIHNFLDGAAPLTQSGLATPVLGQEGQISGKVDCSKTPGQCNFTASLDDALSIAGNLKKGGFLQDQFLEFDAIKQWVDADLPVGARIVWFSGGAHFIALDGYREFKSGLQQVHVQDPLYLSSLQNYDDLVNDYPPGGNWQDTYLVTK